MIASGRCSRSSCVHQTAVRDIPLNEATSLAGRRYRRAVAGCIGALVEDDDVAARLFEPHLHEIGADKPGSSGNEDFWQTWTSRGDGRRIPFIVAIHVMSDLAPLIEAQRTPALDEYANGGWDTTENVTCAPSVLNIS